MGVVPDIKHGNIAEKKLNKRLQGRQTLASGALVFDKADIKVGGFRIESKSTVNNSMSVKFGWLNKVSGEALDHLEYPALALQFVLPDGSIRRNGGWVCIKESEFTEYLELRKKYKEE